MKFRFLFPLGIIVLGALLRFYKLDWGQGLFTHPDEYHIVTSAMQLSFPAQMNPHFFSYGTVTIYLIYFTQEVFKYFQQITNSQITIPNLFLIGRFYSALFSTLTIFMVYKICRLFLSKNFSYLSAFLAGTTPGLIQQAHFATPESNLTFFLFSSLFFIIKFLKQNKTKSLVLSSIFLGLALGTKISSIVFLLPLIIAILIGPYFKNPLVKIVLTVKRFFRNSLNPVKLIIISMISLVITFALVDPYVFLDFPAFKNNLEYEGGLAVGKFPVFYTRQFIETIPVLFQLEKILPFALGPSLLLFSILGFSLLIFELIRKRKAELAITTIAFLSLFLSNAFLFAKWTRFIAPTFPFFAIFASFLLERIYIKNKIISQIFIVLLLISTLLWTTAFFSIYSQPDVRVTSSDWIEKNLPKNSIFLLEGGNMIDIPLKGSFTKISLDFYNLETDLQTRSAIFQALKESDYFLIQSRRVFMNHQRLSDAFPITSRFYDKLFSEKLGFKEINKFHSFPMLKIGDIKIEIPDEKAEETWSVFDHPVIRIFEKTKQLSYEEYAKILEIQ